MTKSSNEGDITSRPVTTPDEVLSVARSVMTESDVLELTRLAIEDAKEGNAQARTFIQAIMFPKDTAVVEDKRYKRIVMCSFAEFNEIESLKAEIVRLRAKLAEAGIEA